MFVIGKYVPGISITTLCLFAIIGDGPTKIEFY